MNISLGDLADRYSICKLKIERANILCIEEISAIMADLDKTPEIYTWVERLYKVNGEIWDLESDIRKGKEQELGLEEVGRRAIAIRGKNKIRIEIKNEINSIFKSGYKEIKGDHASE